MNHDNIARFVGAVMEAPKFKVLHEYCAKGSLQVSPSLNCANFTLI